MDDTRCARCDADLKVVPSVLHVAPLREDDEWLCQNCYDNAAENIDRAYKGLD